MGEHYIRSPPSSLQNHLLVQPPVHCAGSSRLLPNCGDEYASLSQLVLVMQHLNAGIAGAFAAPDRFQLMAAVAEGWAYVPELAREVLMYQ